MQARPWFWVAVSGGILLALTAPVLSLRLGFSDEGNFNEETTTRQAYDLVAEGFGPTRPLIQDAKTREERAQNRRVEFHIVASEEEPPAEAPAN